MKDFRNYFHTDFHRLRKSYYWLIGIVGVTFVLFFSLGADLFQKDLISGNVLSTYVMSTIMSGSLITYSFCAFPFAGIYPEEREHNYIRYSVIRGNLKAYVISKTVIIYLSSVIVMLLGTLLFLFLCRIQVPWTDWINDDYGLELAGAYGSILEQGHVILYCVLYALHMGFVAATMSNLAAVCSIFISNTVLVYLFPMLAFRVLVSLSIGGYNIYAFYPFVKIFANDGINLLFWSIVSMVVSALSSIGCYFGLKSKI